MPTKTSRSRQNSDGNDRNPRAGRVGRREVHGERTVLDAVTREAAVCNLFCEGLMIPELIEKMVEMYGPAGDMNRAQPYRIVRAAAKKGRLKYVPDPDDLMSRMILERYGGLHRAHVVRTTIATDVARETARLLLRLVRECHLEDKKRNEVHIGFAAGLSMREVAQVFAKLLTYPEPDLPENIAFHALVAGHDPRDPTTDPNAFFTFFLTPPSITIKPSFMGLHAPAMVPWQEIKKLRSTPEIREAYDAAKQLDIVVTSGSDWNDEHSALRFCMERSQSSMTTLRNLGVIGDMLWRPISERGPILQRTAVRALTVLELSDLPTLIRKKKRVLLMLGPCAVCHHPKGRLLKGILSHEEQLASHLVVDSGTALELLREIGAF